MQSVLVNYAPQVPKLVLEGVEEKEKDENIQKEENEEVDEKKEKQEKVCEPDALFDALAARLKFHNALGLGLPVGGEDAQDAWSNFKSLEFDGGPRARKKGSPATDRLMANLNNNAAQYLHLFLALMVLRAFLF